VSEFSQKLFNLFDTDHSGYIDFKEFVVALAVLSRKVSNEDSIRLAFKAFDRNNDGTLTEEDIRTIIRTGWKTVSQSEVHDIFAAFDAKGDGRIDYEEFLTFLKRHPEVSVPQPISPRMRTRCS
jgi:Ca2+-binding EF-hand superfamily protein